MGNTRKIRFFTCLISFLLLSESPALASESAPLRVLALGGSSGSHRTAEMLQLASQALAPRNVSITYTEDIARLVRTSLDQFNVLLIYKDDGELPPNIETDLLDWISDGGGLLAVHCASHCFRHSTAYTQLVGGRFDRHGAETFRSRIVDAQHPAVHNVASFESWDETYVHNQLSDDRRVLMVRDEAGGYEPYTWIRHHGQGRVYYTALGHDDRTWRNPAFHRLLHQALLWLAHRANDRPARTAIDGTPPAPLAADEAIQYMHLPEGFRAELFAAEPDVQMPLAMAFDERGRLWVLESFDYPNHVRPDSRGIDRIKILEDTTGDGRADRTTIFAEGLNIPTGITFGGGGVIVANAPHIYLFRDTDGDGVADEQTTLLSGFGRFDTHAVLSNLWYAPDNWIWGCVGYSGGSIEIDGRRQDFKMGLFRFRPDGSDFEFVTSTDNNTWGLGFTADGDVLASTANRHHSWYLAIPNRAFERVRGWYAAGSRYNADHHRSHSISGPSRQWDHQGGFTSATNATVYTADGFPPELRNRAMFVCEPTVQVVHTNLLGRRGSDLVARDGYNLVASEDPWFAPTQALVGPDGAVWVLDFYSYSVLHNKPDEPKSDHGAGNAWLGNQHRDRDRARIYRIVHQDHTPTPPPVLSPSDTKGLIAALAHPNLHWRLTAQRLLVEQASPATIARLSSRMVESDNPHEIQHILLTLDGLNAFAEPSNAAWAVLEAGLRSKFSPVLRAVLSILPRTKGSVSRIVQAGVLEHDDPLVRRDALLALGEMPASPPAASALIALLGDPATSNDAWLSLAITSAAAASDYEFLSSILQPLPSDVPAELASSVTRVVAEHFARGNSSARVTELLASLERASTLVAVHLLLGLEAGWSGDPPQLDEVGWQRLANQAASTAPTVRVRFASLADQWGVGKHFAPLVYELREPLLAQVADNAADEAIRLDAARQLLALDADGPTLDALLATITPRATPEYASHLFSLLSESNIQVLGSLVIEHWPSYTPAAQSQALALLLRRIEWTSALLDGLEHGPLTRNDLPIDRVQQLLAHPHSPLRSRAQEVLARAGQLPNADRQALLAQWLPLADRPGDPVFGREAFQSIVQVPSAGDLGTSWTRPDWHWRAFAN